MSFAYPTVLYLLLAPALLLYWVWNRQGGGVALPFDHRQGGGSRGWGFVITLAECLPALILAAVIFVLAGPQKISDPKTKKVMTNIEFCVDISCSMLAEFDNGNRYDASMAAIGKFLDRRPDDAFGLTFFGNSVLHWVPLSNDTSAIRCAPPFMKPDKVPPWFNGTEIGKALVACRDILTQRDEGDRMIILVSDGISFDLEGGRDMELAREFRDLNIVVNAIHIASSEPPDSIVNVTTLTGGDVYNPGDNESLKTVFQNIDEMQETRVQQVSAESQDNFLPFCLAGLILLTMQLLALFGLRYNPW